MNKKSTYCMLLVLAGCGDLAFVNPTNDQVVTGLPPGANAVDVPIVIDFTGSTDGRDIVLDGNLDITTAPIAGFTTTTGGGQNNWDRVSGKYPMAPGMHTLKASADYQDWTFSTQTVTKTVAFNVAPPDLWPRVTATPTRSGIAQHVTFDITLHNLGESDAQNVSVLFYTSLPAGIITLNNAGFGCHMPNGYSPRFGMRCDGGTIPRLRTVTISVVLSFSSPGNNTLAVFADPDNSIKEADESNNLDNANVMIQ